MRIHARVRAAFVSAVLAAGMAACGGDDDAAAGSETTESSSLAEGTTTTTARPSPEDLAVAAYVASWDATFRAVNPPEQLPEIAELHTGEALSETVNLIATKQRLGHRIEGSMAPNPVVVSTTSTEVLLDDCAIENSVEYDAAGAVVDTAENAAYNYQVTIVNEDGAWKVADFERREEPCEPA